MPSTSERYDAVVITSVYSACAVACSATRSHSSRPLPPACAVTGPDQHTRRPPRNSQRDEQADRRHVRADRLPDMARSGLIEAYPCGRCRYTQEETTSALHAALDTLGALYVESSDAYTGTGSLLVTDLGIAPNLCCDASIRRRRASRYGMHDRRPDSFLFLVMILPVASNAVGRLDVRQACNRRLLAFSEVTPRGRDTACQMFRQLSTPTNEPVGLLRERRALTGRTARWSQRWEYRGEVYGGSAGTIASHSCTRREVKIVEPWALVRESAVEKWCRVAHFRLPRVNT
ncbi:hypothetical protein PsYK624_146790 [Phanerochaete sordida]|uniref:Uncharacterized protein n=1 Tax=Phanerochaete sordida TaxID=48140 RepID=A0A9P3GN19_9APHY|nr:hypothetical protein PsYK624_146790 [Phanerochaete sordida]